MDMVKRGWTSIAVTVSPPNKDFPKGGVYNRLEKLLVRRKESWNSVIERLLDAYEQGLQNAK